jgi:hypothetical protein
MAVKKGDLIDEFKRHKDGCGLVVKIMGGGEGFQKIVCCGHELTAEDIVPTVTSSVGRKLGHTPIGVILDEKKLHADSCGLRIMIIDGGAGLQEVICCGHRLTMNAMRDLKLDRRGAPANPPQAARLSQGSGQSENGDWGTNNLKGSA